MDERELIRRAQKLIRRYDNMEIVGSRGEWSGNARQGFNFNPLDGSGGGGGGGGSVIQTGACCIDGNCFQTTQVNCELQGGTYMGNGTDCADQACPSETHGACCVLDNCSIETPEHCAAIGGDYQGDNTTCIPNPCERPDCSCGFPAFDGSGRQFLTQTRSMTYSETNQGDGFGGCTCDAEGNSLWEEHYDPSDCSLSCDCSGTVTRTNPEHPINECADNYSICGAGFDPYSFIGTFTPEQAVGCQSATCGSCAAYTLNLDSDTATQRVFSFVNDDCGGGGSHSGSITVTLSDECNPV